MAFIIGSVIASKSKEEIYIEITYCIVQVHGSSITAIKQFIVSYTLLFNNHQIFLCCIEESKSGNNLILNLATFQIFITEAYFKTLVLQ